MPLPLSAFSKMRSKCFMCSNFVCKVHISFKIPLFTPPVKVILDTESSSNIQTTRATHRMFWTLTASEVFLPLHENSPIWLVIRSEMILNGFHPAQLSKWFQLYITSHKQIIRGESQKAQFRPPNWHEAGTSALHEAWVRWSLLSVTCGWEGFTPDYIKTS